MAKTATKLKPLTDEVEFFRDVEQLSDEWRNLRLGTITASSMSKVLAQGEGKVRAAYLRQLAGERLTGIPAEGFDTPAMARGREMEGEARDWYSRTRFADCSPVGFVRRLVRCPLGTDFAVGCSPDSQTGPRKGLEIKTARPDLLIEILERGAAGLPTEHRAQTQGTMWVCDWDAIDLVVFYRGMPTNAKFTVLRDDDYIAKLRDECERFDYDLRMLVEKIRRMG